MFWDRPTLFQCCLQCDGKFLRHVSDTTLICGGAGYWTLQLCNFCPISATAGPGFMVVFLYEKCHRKGPSQCVEIGTIDQMKCLVVQSCLLSVFTAMGREGGEFEQRVCKKSAGAVNFPQNKTDPKMFGGPKIGPAKLVDFEAAPTSVRLQLKGEVCWHPAVVCWCKEKAFRDH